MKTSEVKAFAELELIELYILSCVFFLTSSYIMTLLGKRPSWMKKFIPGKRAAVVGGLVLAGLGKMVADRGRQERLDEAQHPRYNKPPPAPSQPTRDPCSAVMCPKGIASRRDYLKWASKGGHPDKGGSTSTFQAVNNCQSTGKFCKR